MAWEPFENKQQELWEWIINTIIVAALCYGIYRGINWIFQKGESKDID